jgi:RNA polymerase sigma factor (sigma-70 family)
VSQLSVSRNYLLMRLDFASAGEHELLRASVEDAAAFEELFARHAANMRGWLAWQVRDVALANDLLAETFAEAWRARRRFSGRDAGTGLAWLYGIARNQLRVHYRRGRVETAARRRIGMSVDVPHDDNLEQVLARLDAQLLRLLLDEALDRLPAVQRAAIDARVVRELPYPAVADVLECSETNARAHVSRGLRALNTMLTGARP